MDPFLWRGAQAALSACRSGIHADAALQQILDDAEEELLLGPVAVLARFHADDVGDDNDTDDDDTNTEPDGESDENTGAPCDEAWVSGKVVIASKHLYFWWVQRDLEDGPTAATAKSMGPRNDFKINAFSINLHALMGSNTPVSFETVDDADNNVDDENDGACDAAAAVYIQISSSGNGAPDGADDDGSEQLFELTLKPTGTTVPEEIQHVCQQLFDEISKMIALNPIDPNTDETDDGGAGAFGDCSGGWITSEDDMDPASMMTMMGFHGIEDSSEDLICATLTDDVPATGDERNTMLERLDNLLIVPPEYEIHSSNNDDNDNAGQFDDADEDDDIL
jgi:hypothetical protein